MIILKEIIGKQNIADLPSMIQANLCILLHAINIVRKEYKKPMIVTSGLRDIEKHKEIYRKKGIPEEDIPMGSKHLSGEAIDILDRDGSLADWVSKNVSVLKKAGLWCERMDYTHGWVHFQIVPPKSGNRFFIP